MTKQEIERAIKNGESVWCVYKDQSNIYEIKAVEIEKVLSNTFLWGKEYYSNIKDVFKTKAEAEHYLHHANISRTEQLPFITWEEFLKEIQLKFIACDGVSNMILYYCDNTIYLVDDEYPEFNTTSWELTEENFYKAYDECVRLFRGGE